MKTITLTDEEASDVACIIREYAREIRRDAAGVALTMFRDAMERAAESRDQLASKFESD